MHADLQPPFCVAEGHTEAHHHHIEPSDKISLPKANRHLFHINISSQNGVRKQRHNKQRSVERHCFGDGHLFSIRSLWEGMMYNSSSVFVTWRKVKKPGAAGISLASFLSAVPSGDFRKM